MGDRAQEVEDAWVSVLEYLRSANLDPAKVVGEQDVRTIVGAKVKDPLIADAVIARWKEVSPSTFGVPGVAPQGERESRKRGHYPLCVRSGGPVDPATSIMVPFGQLEEFALAERALRGDGTVFIYGPYQTGKTSLAHELGRQWERPTKAARPAGSGDVTAFAGHAIYTRCVKGTPGNPADMWSMLGVEVCRDQGIEPAIKTPTLVEFTDLLGMVRKSHGGTPQLLIVDELDILAYAESKDALVALLDFFRAERDRLHGRISTVCIGTLAHHAIIELVPERPGSPWNAGAIIRVGEITPPQMSVLLESLQTEQYVKFAPGAMSSICSSIHLWTCGHKGLVGYCLETLQKTASSSLIVTFAMWQGRLCRKTIEEYRKKFAASIVKSVEKHAAQLRSMLHSAESTTLLVPAAALALASSGLVREVVSDSTGYAEPSYEFSSPLMEELFIATLYDPSRAAETFELGEDYEKWDVAGLIKAALLHADSTVLSSVLSRNRNSLHERVLSSELHASFKALLASKYHLFPEMHPVPNSTLRIDELISNGAE